MNTTDFLDPGFFEYLLLIIGISFIILITFMVGVFVHTRHSKIMSIADEVRARGPVYSVLYKGDGSIEVITHKTPEDIRQEIADEHGLTLDQVVLK